MPNTAVGACLFSLSLPLPVAWKCSVGLRNVRFPSLVALWEACSPEWAFRFVQPRLARPSPFDSPDRRPWRLLLATDLRKNKTSKHSCYPGVQRPHEHWSIEAHGYPQIPKNCCWDMLNFPSEEQHLSQSGDAARVTVQKWVVSHTGRQGGRGTEKPSHSKAHKATARAHARSEQAVREGCCSQQRTDRNRDKQRANIRSTIERLASIQVVFASSFHLWSNHWQGMCAVRADRRVCGWLSSDFDVGWMIYYKASPAPSPLSMMLQTEHPSSFISCKDCSYYNHLSHHVRSPP